jgi:UDP-2-acetamido-3-amino-2,3-dideoxy-glucuronate N-acetyltransferase
MTGAPDVAYFKHDSAYVDEGSSVGEGTKIWHFCHVQRGASIGRGCVLGQNVNIGADVRIGNFVKIQNNVSVYTGTIVEDYVFLGPSCVLTNVTNPRAEIDRHALFEPTLIGRGASIGANATITSGVEVGRYAFVGAGAVLTRSVADYALVIGVPARQVGWVSRHGLPLRDPDPAGVFTCPESGLRYRLAPDRRLQCLDAGEEEELPDRYRKGQRSYDAIVHGKP